MLSGSVAEQARRFAADMVVLAELTAMVPRCPFDESGATPWTSFRREVAVARKVSDRTAAADIRAAVALTTRTSRCASTPILTATRSASSSEEVCAASP